MEPLSLRDREVPEVLAVARLGSVTLEDGALVKSVAECHGRWGVWGFSVLEVPDGDYEHLARLRPIVATRRRLRLGAPAAPRPCPPTKPYVSGGAYIDRMSDYCRGCRYDPKARTGDDACPYTTLYWDFLSRHRDQLAGNHRMAQPLRGLDRFSNLDEVRSRATEVLDQLDAGTL